MSAHLSPLHITLDTNIPSILYVFSSTLTNPSINFDVRSAFCLSEDDTKSKSFVNISLSRFFEYSIICRNLSVDSFKTSAFACFDFFAVS